MGYTKTVNNNPSNNILVTCDSITKACRKNMINTSPVNIEAVTISNDRKEPVVPFSDVNCSSIMSVLFISILCCPIQVVFGVKLTFDIRNYKFSSSKISKSIEFL